MRRTPTLSGGSPGERLRARPRRCGTCDWKPSLKSWSCESLIISWLLASCMVSLTDPEPSDRNTPVFPLLMFMIPSSMTCGKLWEQGHWG